MQPTHQNPSILFQNPPTPEQLLEVEHRKPAARAALIARLARWEQTGATGCPDIEGLEWPAEELPSLAVTT